MGMAFGLIKKEHSKEYKVFEEMEEDYEADKEKLIYGVQMGVFNRAQEIEGFQLGLFNNIVKEKVTGFQLSYHQNYAGDLIGVQVAVNNIAFDIKGIQTGLINVTEEKVYGVQTGLLNVTNCEDSIFRGLQIGLINYCSRDSIGVQIGVINYRKENPWYSKIIPLIAVRTKRKKSIDEYF